MKTFAALFLAVVLICSALSSQDCFMPPGGYTLYSTTAPEYLPPAITGFVSEGPNFSGDWSLEDSTNNASVTFSDHTGRTSTLSVTGAGTVTIHNFVTDITNNDTTSCQQTFNVANYTRNVATNPALSGGCPLNLTIVIDESESIADNMSAQIIRDAVIALASGLVNTGSTLAIIEFDTRAERIALNGNVELQTIDDDLIGYLNTYLDNDYNPVGDVLNLIGGTNWEDALVKANSVVGTDFVLMITDGRPTFYTTVMGMNGVAGEGDAFDLTALKEASDAANILKNSGKRMFVAGLDFPSDTQSLKDISGNNQYLLGQSIDQLFEADFTLVAPSSLVPLFMEIGQVPCIIEIIPTMGEWSIIIVGLLLLILGVTAIRSNELRANFQ